jgi:hypothetical protein
MQWMSKHLAPRSEVAQLPPADTSSSPSYMKIARMTGPWSSDAVAFIFSKMKEDGFTGVIVSITREDWRLQRAVIVSVPQTASEQRIPHVIS